MPLLARPIDHLCRLAEHRRSAGADGLMARSPDIAERQGQKADAGHHSAPDHRPGELEFRRIGVDQHQRPEQEGHKPSRSKHHGRVERLRDQEGEPKQHQRKPGVVHRQHVQGIQAKDKADGADHARRDCPGLLNSKMRP